MTPETAWQRVYTTLQKNLAKQQFDTWLKETRFLRCDGNTYVIGVPTEHVADWLNRELRNLILRTLAQVTFVGDVDVAFELDPFLLRQQSPRPLRLPPAKPTPATDGRFTFATFVPYALNQEAYTTIRSLTPTSSPLLIHAGAALGKTHLLHALAQTHNNAPIHDAATFDPTTTADWPILLLDDVHNLPREKPHQARMRTLFRELTNAGILIVATSNRPAAMLGTALPWAKTVTIQPPNFGHRQHILRTKAAARGIPLPADMVVAIAKYASQSIQELDDALNKIGAYALLSNGQIDRNLIQVALSDLLPSPVTITIADIIAAVSIYYRVNTESLLASGRARTIVYPRQVIMYLARTETNASFQEIGRALGNRDHSTVLHGYEKITEMVARNDSIRRDILEIRTQLYDTISP